MTLWWQPPTADLKADTTSLTNLQKMTDSATSFEETASKNFDLALSLAPKGVPTDLGPWINSWVQSGETEEKAIKMFLLMLRHFLPAQMNMQKLCPVQLGAQGINRGFP